MVIIRKTPYSQENQDFSDKGHLCAQTALYPLIFPNSQLQFIPLPEEQAMTLDADMGVDKHLLVKVQSLRESFSVLVQERFRDTEWVNKQDITITEWNNNSNQPGELYKIKSEMMLYGYYDEQHNKFPDAIACSMLTLKVKIAQGLIKHTTGINSRTNQTFLCFRFADLEQHNIAVWRLPSGRIVNHPLVKQCFHADTHRWAFARYFLAMQAKRSDPLDMRRMIEHYMSLSFREIAEEVS